MSTRGGYLYKQRHKLRRRRKRALRRGCEFGQDSGWDMTPLTLEEANVWESSGGWLQTTIGVAWARFNAIPPQYPRTHVPGPWGVPRKDPARAKYLLYGITEKL